MPAKVLIASKDGQLRREMSFATGAPHKSDGQDWIILRESQSIGRKFDFRLAAGGDVPINGPPGERTLDLPAGEYFVQAVYDRWLVAQWPNDWRNIRGGPRDGGGDEPLPWEHLSPAQMNEPFMVSDAATMTVTDPNSTEPQKSSAVSVATFLHLDIKNAAVIAGRDVEMTIRETNRTNEPIEVFDPFVDHLFAMPRALELTMSTSDGVELGDLFIPRDSRRVVAASPRHWMTMPPGATLGRTFTYQCGSVPGTVFGIATVLPPGKYFLQLRAYESFLSGPPIVLLNPNDVGKEWNDPAYVEWRRTFPGLEICRSNRVELEILPRTGD
jgi:hypothetical protein